MQSFEVSPISSQDFDDSMTKKSNVLLSRRRKSVDESKIICRHYYTPQEYTSKTSRIRKVQRTNIRKIKISNVSYEMVIRHRKLAFKSYLNNVFGKGSSLSVYQEDKHYQSATQLKLPRKKQ